MHSSNRLSLPVEQLLDSMLTVFLTFPPRILLRIEPLIIQPDKSSCKSVGSRQAFNLDLSGVGSSHYFVNI